MSAKYKALLDADLIIYRAGFAVETKVVSEQDGWTTTSFEVEPLENSIQIVKDTMEFILFELGTNEYEVYLSGDTNFRKDLATVKPYKGNRKNIRHPVHLAGLREYLIENHSAIVADNQEADDLLGIRLTELGEEGVLCSIDKDLLMVPGKHYNWIKGKKKIVSEKEGTFNFYKQLLTGDATDNIPGCPTIGEKRAVKALANATSPSSLYTIVKDLYHEKLQKFSNRICDSMVYNNGIVCYNSWKDNSLIELSLDDYLTEIGRLLWIRRAANEMWTPPVVKEIK